jgi:hypothetical protein
MSLARIKPELVKQVMDAANRAAASMAAKAGDPDADRANRTPSQHEAAFHPSFDEDVEPLGVEKGFPSRIAAQLATHYRKDKNVA